MPAKALADQSGLPVRIWKPLAWAWMGQQPATSATAATQLAAPPGTEPGRAACRARAVFGLELDTIRLGIEGETWLLAYAGQCASNAVHFTCILDGATHRARCDEALTRRAGSGNDCDGRLFRCEMTKLPQQAAVHQAHIVIVDDSTANLKLYAKLAAGVEPSVNVHSFNDPRKALAWLGDNAADLVISDYKMPTMHGAEFTRLVRQVPTCPDVPVVVVTAYADHDFRIAALDAGASDFLRSPVDYLEFRTRARNLLRLGRHQRLMRDRAFSLEHQLEESEKSRDQLLRESREWLAQVIDTVPAMVSATDAQGNCIFVNAYQSSVLGAAGRPLCGPNVEQLDRQVLASGKALDGFEETL